MTGNTFKQVAGSAPFTYPDTLLRAVRQSDATGLEIALFGLPYGGGTIARDGTRYGLGQMRQMSFNIRGTNLSTGQSPFEVARCAVFYPSFVTKFSALKWVCRINIFVSLCPVIVFTSTGFNPFSKNLEVAS